MEKLAPWRHKPIKDYTVQDVLDAYEEGFFTVCGDGKIKFITNDIAAV